MKYLRLIIGLYFAFCFLSSCKPFVSLSIRPETVCDGDEAFLVWRSNGVNSRMLTRNGEAITGANLRKKTDSILVVQHGNSTYRMTGESSDGQKVAEIRSRTLSAGESMLKLLNFTWPGCIGENSGRYPAINDLSIAGSIEVQAVANQSNRRVRVTHGDISADIERSQSTTEFNGLSLVGPWTITLLDLRSNEGCPPRNQTGGANAYENPPSINLGVTYGCP